jgi:hypothetical protein
MDDGLDNGAGFFIAIAPYSHALYIDETKIRMASQ